MNCKIEVDGKEIEIYKVSLKDWLASGKVSRFTNDKGEWTDTDNKPKQETGERVEKPIEKSADKVRGEDVEVGEKRPRIYNKKR